MKPHSEIRYAIKYGPLSPGGKHYFGGMMSCHKKDLPNNIGKKVKVRVTEIIGKASAKQ